MKSKIAVVKKGEDLLKKLDEITSYISNDRDMEENRRIEFAKAFGWFKKKGAYDYQEEYRTPTWTEIFIKLGKLLENQKALLYVQDVENLKLEIQRLSVEVENIKFPLK